MKRLMSIVLEYIKNHWLRYLLCVIFVAAVVITNNVLKESFTSKIIYSDGIFIGGALLIGYGLLVLCNYFGAFNMFQMMFNRHIVDGRREQFYEFSERKRLERKPAVMNFIDFEVVGIICLIIAKLLLI